MNNIDTKQEAPISVSSTLSKNHFVDREGNVYSNLLVGSKYGKIGKLKKLKGIPCHGYRFIQFGNKRVKRGALILETFTGNRPKGAFVCHRNDIKNDDRLDNLYWGTRRDNIRDAQINKRYRYGDKHQNVRVTEKQVAWLRIRKPKQTEQKLIAYYWGVNYKTIGNIVYGCAR